MPKKLSPFEINPWIEKKSYTQEKAKELLKEDRGEKVEEFKRIIRAKNPEEKEVEINLDKERKYWQEFYENHNFKDKVEIPEIQLTKDQKQEIKTLIEKGYVDKMAVIADHLSYQELGKEMTRGYEETEQGFNFKSDGSFSQLDSQETKEKPQYRIIFFKQVKELDQDPILKQTLNKSPNQIKERLRNLKRQESLNLEGMSLKDYLIIQREFFEQTNPRTKEEIQDENRHLDFEVWIQCLKSYFVSSDRFSGASWNGHPAGLSVVAIEASNFLSNGGSRLSRSFDL